MHADRLNRLERLLYDVAAADVHGIILATHIAMTGRLGR
jgi:hypothetical protein